MTGFPEWVQPLTWIWSKREFAAKKLIELREWLRGKSDLLVMGPGGTGKTTLARLLSGEFDLLLDTPEPYSESRFVEKYGLADKPDVGVIVLPGQENRRAETWRGYLDGISSGKYKGIIYIVFFGYHSFDQLSYKEHRLYKGLKEKFMADYLADRRDEEALVFEELIGHFRNNSEKQWLFIVVAKQDLWWENRDEVRRHYEEGIFGAKLKLLSQQLGDGKFRHEIFFTSLVIRNFDTMHRERLKANAKGYDAPFQVNTLRKLFESISLVKDWEREL